MDKVTYIAVDKEKFSIYHTIYSDSNIFVGYGWNDQIKRFEGDVTGYFILLKDELIGGFTLVRNKLSNPFMVPPFCDRLIFWKVVLEYASQICCEDKLTLSSIAEVDVEVLARYFTVTKETVQKIMLRPTAQCDSSLKESFIYSQPSERDLSSIVDVVYQSHSKGYTAKYSTIDKLAIENDIKMRFESFTKTKSLHLSTIVREAANNDIVGVCIAGIYPDSPNNFATIHQVSVLSDYRRNGIARAMMSRSINSAYTISPVITLSVMVGNPAEHLYNKLGFSPTSSYCHLTYNK